MAELTERTLGYGFGLLGGLFVLIGAAAAIALSVADLLTAHPVGTIRAGSEAVALLAVGALALGFAYLGQHAWRNRGVVSGGALLVLALVGWAVLGSGSNVVVLIGMIFVFLGGVLFLLEPAKHVVRRVATAV